MANGQVTKAEVEQVLGQFQDPETGRSIVKMGQVGDLKLDGERISLTLALTTYCAPLWKETRAALAEQLRGRFPNLSEVDVELKVHERPAEKIGEVGVAAKSVIAVGSGKGGVGKSTVAAVLAYGLSGAGCKVGLMDADIYGPSIPHLIGTHDRPVPAGARLRPVMVDGLEVMSIGLLIPPEEAVIWRGPMLHSTITQFLRDISWGNLDYLIIDMPPGTGDVALSLSQLLPLSGAVVVCTPQDLALLDVTKAIAMFRKVNIEVLGMVENMSHFVCPDCGSRHEIFGSGGAKRRAEELGVPFLGEIPLNVQLRILGDEGRVGSSLQDKTSAPYLEEVCHRLVSNLAAAHKAHPPVPSLSILSGPGAKS